MGRKQRTPKPLRSDYSPFGRSVAAGPDRVMTSETHPLEVNWFGFDHRWIEGDVGMTFAPGKHASSQTMGARWERSLGADLARLVAMGCTHLVTLMEEFELGKHKMHDFADRVRAAGITLIRFPIQDLGTPGSLTATNDLVKSILRLARQGSKVVIHCLGGKGRTGLIGACILCQLGYDPTNAIRVTRKVRANTIETAAQERYITTYANDSMTRKGKLFIPWTAPADRFHARPTKSFAEYTAPRPAQQSLDFSAAPSPPEMSDAELDTWIDQQVRLRSGR